MFAVLAILIVSFVGVSTVFGFIGWAIREHLQASKYRALIKTYEQLKAAAPATQSSNEWVINFKEGRALKHMTIEAKTETEAISKFIKSGTRYSSIEGVNKK